MPDAADVAPNENLLRVGVTTNSPPVIYRQGKKIVGLEADFAKKFAEYLGKSLRFVELKWDDQIQALLDDRIDIIMSGMSITEMRRVRIAFSKPYFRTGQMGLTHMRSQRYFSQGYFSMRVAASTLKFGVEKATTGEFYVKKSFQNAKDIISYSSPKEAAEALIRKRVDVVIHDAPIILMLASEHQADGLIPVAGLLTEEYLGWGMRKPDEELIKSADDFITKLENEGQLDSIINRWIPILK
jgi:polar amino acid transport system substrate-binding protein